MAEEEREGIADFRSHAPPQLRRSMGEQFAALLAEHRTSAEVDTSDVDPEEYVNRIEQEIEHEHENEADGSGSGGAGSLRVGSQEGRG
jgi:hypothetical protein